MSPEQIGALAWDRRGGLLPAIVQDADTHRVLMLGYMSREALQATLESGRVTFHSRSRGHLWTKGETSGNSLALVAMETDCDHDALLVQARPLGPTCHFGRTSCFVHAPGALLAELDAMVAARRHEPVEGSYTSALFSRGTRAIAQKVGEEGVEAALAALAESDEALAGESADLLYHLIVLLRSRDLSLADAVRVLAARTG